MSQRRKCTIGIDVGGTNTDTVICDNASGSVLSCLKIPTRHFDYEGTLSQSIGSILKSSGISPESVSSLNISTTLSTNAILENKLAPVNLILIGFSRYPHVIKEIETYLKPYRSLFLKGGHTGWGREREPFTPYPLENFVSEHKGELFAVSSFYSSRNPEHEVAARRIIAQNGGGKVTCGHELTRSKLNSVKRTITAYLNSALIPLTSKLIRGIESVAAGHRIDAPVMFVRSDSSLVSSEWCSNFPIETIFSGPAASLRGALKIAGISDGESVVVADIGGTSTDIGRVMRGKSVFTEEGAVIGGYKTMIPSLEIKTAALGGDSFIHIGTDGCCSVGPERALPYCRVPEISRMHKERVELDLSNGDQSEYLLPADGKFDTGSAVIDFLQSGVRSTEETKEFINASHGGASRQILSEILREGTALYCALTPTDVFNFLQASSVGDTSLSFRAVEMFAKRCGKTPRTLACAVEECIAGLLAGNISSACGREKFAKIIYIGAPAASFAPIAETTFIPDGGAVAGAVGAASASVGLTCQVYIMHSFSNETFTAFMPFKTLFSDNLGELICSAEREVALYLRGKAAEAGAEEVEITRERTDSYLNGVKKISALTSVTVTYRACPLSKTHKK